MYKMLTRNGLMTSRVDNEKYLFLSRRDHLDTGMKCNVDSFVDATKPIDTTREGEIQKREDRDDEEGEISDARSRKGKFGLRVITTEITTLHHEQFVDRIVNSRVQALRQRRGVVR